MDILRLLFLYALGGVFILIAFAALFGRGRGTRVVQGRGRLYSSVGYAGSPTTLRFRNGKVVDANGNEVKTLPLKDLLKTRKNDNSL